MIFHLILEDFGHAVFVNDKTTKVARHLQPHHVRFRPIRDRSHLAL